MSHRQNNGYQGIFTPADIDRLVADMDRYQISIELKKFIVYICERNIYRQESSYKDYLNLCLASYFVLNQSGYKKLSNGLELMPLDLLGQKTAKLLSFMPGLHKEVLDLLEIKSESHPKENRVICLMVDECGMTAGVIPVSGRPYGIVDDGVKLTLNPAKFITHIWIRTLCGSWISPLAYYFTRQPAIPSELKNQIFECINKLNAINLDVVVVNIKLRLNFLELAELLGVGPDKQTFKVGDKEVVLIFDAPHMMNVTRNNLMKHSLKMEDGGQTSWKHLKTFFVKESESTRKTTKLTESHIKPNKYDRTLPTLAIEVLSETVANEIKKYVRAGKLPTGALATADFIALFDRLFDMLNSVHEVCINEYSCGYKATQRQKQYLNKCLRFLETLKVFDNNGEEKTGEVKFIKAWLTTIRGLMKLWEIIREKNHKFLLTRKTSSEPLDKFIVTCKLTAHSSRDPNPLEFFTIYKEVFVRFYFLFESMLSIDDMDMVMFAEMVYKRIPAVLHNLGNPNPQRQVPLHRDEFLQMIFNMFLMYRQTGLLFH